MKHAAITKEDTAKSAPPQQISNNLRPFRQHRGPVRITRCSSHPSQVAKFATTTTLTKKLDELAAELKPEQKKEEAALRQKWEEAEQLFERSRFKLGEALCGYKELYKAEKKWKAFLQAIGVNRRTADDYVARYRAASEIPAAYRAAAEKEKVDLGKPAVQNLVPIEEWKKKNNPTTEQAEEAVRKLRDQSKRPAPATVRSSSTPKDRLDPLDNAKQQEHLATEKQLQKQLTSLTGRIAELEAAQKLAEQQKTAEVVRVKAELEAALHTEKAKGNDLDRRVKDVLDEVNKLRERNQELEVEMAKVHEWGKRRR